MCELFGSILPSGLSAGTVCVKEAVMNKRLNPKFGSFLFLVTAMDLEEGQRLIVDRGLELDRVQKLMPTTQGKLKENRLVVEVSLLYKVPYGTVVANPTWENMLPYVDSNPSIVSSLAINKMMSVVLGINPCLPAKLSGGVLETPEQTRGRFTRASRDGSNVSLIVKSRASEIERLTIMGDLSPALESTICVSDSPIRVSALAGREYLLGAKEVEARTLVTTF